MMPLAAPINLLAALFLLVLFAMLSQRRLANLIVLYTWQGAILTACIAMTAYATHSVHLYVSALLNGMLKIVFVPILLRQLARRLNLQWDRETLVQVPTVMLIGLGLVIFAFNAVLPIAAVAHTMNHAIVGIAVASILLSLLIMITRATALSQVIGFLALENSLIFAANSVTYGMPMIIEFGIALDVIVGIFILGVFFFHIREQFDTLDIARIERRGGPR
ncbi:formate hydrogenlyase [Acidiferrobacter thiooxydans]|jgi:hydrogenase-4 component E|uniref:Formate hydrogenlyase n=1 Tax=Acidiferrobacter thiooxydans TaxID=163359 RepID=A0A1C2FYP4_9GAMM|nr:formate hydrogenlyase [Acidiferrobacter thiooxydans]MDA8191101.1 formate hydrogenlyase [Gammaproteobacteria bacterium]RCN56109.1 formate hydrogenlyase [Acidiferrobacter thiooxydans]UEN98606.1 hypothetical protein A9R16_009175 [Acidiferrobacter thiooxydans]